MFCPSGNAVNTSLYAPCRTSCPPGSRKGLTQTRSSGSVTAPGHRLRRTFLQRSGCGSGACLWEQALWERAQPAKGSEAPGRIPETFIVPVFGAPYPRRGSDPPSQRKRRTFQFSKEPRDRVCPSRTVFGQGWPNAEPTWMMRWTPLANTASRCAKIELPKPIDYKRCPHERYLDRD